jgi:hypothetical protein
VKVIPIPDEDAPLVPRDKTKPTDAELLARAVLEMWEEQSKALALWEEQLKALALMPALYDLARRVRDQEEQMRTGDHG